MQTPQLGRAAVIGFLLVGLRLDASEFVVHEWGTFTSVMTATGQMLAGLGLEGESLPAFVHSFPGFPPFNKGLSLPVRGATVKMETPVLYFYSATPRTVGVKVGFEGGAISQWYPDCTSGEKP